MQNEMNSFLDEVVKAFRNFSEKDQRTFLTNINMFHDQFRLGIGLPQPYFILLDHSLLVSMRDAKRKENERASFLSLATFAHFLKQQPGYDIRVAITPLILFEWLEREPLRDEQQYLTELSNIRSLTEGIGLPLYLVGFNSFKQAKKIIKNIAADIDQIGFALNSLRNKKWDITIREGDVIHFLPNITDELVPKLRLKYFSRHYVHLFLRSVIDRAAIGQNTDKYVRTKLRLEMIENIASLVKISKNKLKGAGDLGLLQICSIGSQFASNAKFTFIGLTLDNKLATVLRDHATLEVSSEPIVIGVDDEESIRRKLKSCFGEGNPLTQITKEANQFSKNFGEFMLKLLKDIEEAMRAEAGTDTPEV